MLDHPIHNLLMVELVQKTKMILSHRLNYPDRIVRYRKQVVSGFRIRTKEAFPESDRVRPILAGDQSPSGHKKEGAASNLPAVTPVP
jgi:hypothetical protein